MLSTKLCQNVSFVCKSGFLQNLPSFTPYNSLKIGSWKDTLLIFQIRLILNLNLKISKKKMNYNIQLVTALKRTISINVSPDLERIYKIRA